MATNLAASVQQTKRRETVALVDLDMHGGDLGLFVDLHPSRGLKHLAKDISRLDATIVRSSLITHDSGLDLLACGYEGFEEIDPAPGSAMRIIGLLRSMYRHVFVDCGHVLEPAVKEALDCSDQIVVVTTLSLPVIRRTKRLVATLDAAHYPAGKVVVAVNRYVNEQKQLLSETENMLGLRVAGLIPNDYETARESMEHGKPLTMMAPKTPIGQWYLGAIDHLLAEKVSINRTVAGKGQGMAARLLGRCLSILKPETRRKPSPV